MAEDAGSNQAALAAVALTVLIGMIGTLIFLLLKAPASEDKDAKPAAKAGAAGGRRRGALDRMQQGAARVAAAAAEGEGEEDDDEDAGGDGDRAARRNAQKEQKKQEKKAQQAAQQQMRQDRDSAKSEKQSKYSQKQKEKEVERQRKEEEEKKAKEEKERQEAEEFAKWKEMFAVEAEGEDDGGKEDNAIEKFIDYIKIRKVVNLEDIAADFRMRTAAVIDRIKELEKLDRISGIFDDRGKFVYISSEEMAGVAAWLKKQGRINRADLVAACNRIVRLNPTEEDKALLAQEARTAAADLLEGEGATDGNAAAAAAA